MTTFICESGLAAKRVEITLPQRFFKYFGIITMVYQRFPYSFMPIVKNYGILLFRKFL